MIIILETSECLHVTQIGALYFTYNIFIHIYIYSILYYIPYYYSIHCHTFFSKIRKEKLALLIAEHQ